jgi:hypothetical protein
MKTLGAVLAFAILAAASSSAQAFPVEAAPGFSSRVVEIADGCGQGRYRGPGGACHRFGHGPYPGGDFAGSHRGEGCGPGKYRGPGGACHRLGTGPYPNGNWAPN